MDVKNPLTFAAALAAARIKRDEGDCPVRLTWEPLEKPYKGVSIVQIKATPAGMRKCCSIRHRAAETPFLPAVYYATIDGAFYLTLNETMLRDFIDRSQEKREGKRQTVEVNSSLYISPGAAQADARPDPEVSGETGPRTGVGQCAVLVSALSQLALSRKGPMPPP